jgi:hypothetical protein
MIGLWLVYRAVARPNYGFVDQMCSPGVIHKVPSRPAAPLRVRQAAGLRGLDE